MRKHLFFCLLLLASILLCACEKPEEAPAETSTVPVTEAAAETTVETTEAAAIPETNPPRVIGPDRIEGSAVAIENVSVDFVKELPQSIRGNSTYSVCGFKEEFVLNESQVYGVIHFSITNLSAEEIKIADIHDKFLVELIYDDQYVYSPNSSSWCFFKAGSQLAVVSDMASVGAVKLAPLMTKEVDVYIPCACEVSTEPDKFLMVVFSCEYSGYENLEFNIR